MADLTIECTHCNETNTNPEHEIIKNKVAYNQRFDEGQEMYKCLCQFCGHHFFVPLLPE
jgi:hypothetical protein